MKGYFEHFDKFEPYLTPRDPYMEGIDPPRNLSKYFLTSSDFETTNNSIFSKRALEYFFHYSLVHLMEVSAVLYAHNAFLLCMVVLKT